MVKQAKGRGVVTEARALSKNAARNRVEAASVGKLRVKPGFREMRFKSPLEVHVGDVVEFVESPEGLAVDLVKVGRRS